MNIKKIKVISNEFVEHLKRMLDESFDNVSMKFKADYFLGEDDQGTRGFYFKLSSNICGKFYERFFPISDFGIGADDEEAFMTKIMMDLILTGITFLSIEKLKSNRASLNTKNSLKRGNNIKTYTINLN